MDNTPVTSTAPAAQQGQEHRPAAPSSGVVLKMTPAELRQVQREIYERACRNAGHGTR